MKHVTTTIALILTFTTTSFAQALVINTICGNDTAGYNGDNIFDQNAQLSYPSSVWVDGAGNVLISDRGNQRIRRISAITDTITTIAGTGVRGYLGDGGPAVDAELNDACGIATDDSGNIYIADEENNVIRKIEASTGFIYTIAGTGAAGSSGDSGLAVNAKLTNPIGVCLDKHHNIYISDMGNNKIRKIDSATGIITTFAGTGAFGYSGDTGIAVNALLNSPYGICTDTAGNILIADFDNNVIRKVNILTDTITTIAGIGYPGYAGDSGLATHARLAGPSDVFVDWNNNIYIAELGSGVIRFISSRSGYLYDSGYIYTIAGTGTAGFNGYVTAGWGNLLYTQLQPTGVCVNNYSGEIYIADYDNQMVRHIFGISGIKDLTKSNLQVYPNPVQDNLTITQYGNTYSAYYITNIIGEKVGFGSLSTNQTTLNTSFWSPGIYILTVTNESGARQVMKVVKE